MQKGPLEGFGGSRMPVKAVDVALVPWPAGSGVPKGPLDGFGRFEAWQMAGLNASKKVLMSP